MINRNRPDLKLIQQAITGSKPDINSDEAKDFVMNILKATGIATDQQQNIFPDVDKKIQQSIEQREKRTWKKGIERMMGKGNNEGKQKVVQKVEDEQEEDEYEEEEEESKNSRIDMKEDLDKYEPELHSIPTPKQVKENKTEVLKYSTSYQHNKPLEKHPNIANNQDASDQNLKGNQFLKIQRLRISSIPKKQKQNNSFEQAEQAKKLIDSMQQADDYQNEEFEALEDDLEYTKSMHQVKSVQKKDNGQNQTNVNDEKGKNLQQEKKDQQKQNIFQAKKSATIQIIKDKQEQKVEQKKPLLSPPSDQQQTLNPKQQAQKTQPKKEQKLNQQQMYEQFKKQIGVTQSKKNNISGESLDQSMDPIAEALKNQEKIQQQEQVANTNLSQKSNNNSIKEQTTSTRPPVHKNNNGKFAGASKAILKNLADQDSIDQSMQQYQSQGTINFQLEDAQQSSSKFDDSKSLVFLKNLPKKEQKSQISGDIGDYSDTFDLSASQSVFHQLRSSGMPTPNALKGSSSSQNSQFLSSNPHFIGRGGKAIGSSTSGGGGSKVDSAKFSNYLKTIHSQPPEVEEQDDIDQK